MSNLPKTDAHTACKMWVLTLEQLDSVFGGRDGEVVIVGCTTRPPLGGYPPGTITWNPWLGQPYPRPL
jgi:hypothetical protein